MQSPNVLRIALPGRPLKTCIWYFCCASCTERWGFVYISLVNFYKGICSVGYTCTRGNFGGAYRTYRSVGYRYLGRTEHAEVSGTGIEVVPNHTEVFARVSIPVPNK